MVALAGADRLVAGHCLSDLELLHEVQALELVEDPVDAGAADGALARAQSVLDLDRRQRAGLRVEQLEQRPAGCAGVVIVLREHLRCACRAQLSVCVSAIGLSLGLGPAEQPSARGRH